jgi:hypothetical protein
MKAGGEISVGTTSRAFAGALAAKMAQAAETDPSIRPVKAGYIRRMLQTWGVWPFSVI